MGCQTLSLWSTLGTCGSESVFGKLGACYSLNFERLASIFSIRLLLHISSASCSGRDTVSCYSLLRTVMKSSLRGLPLFLGGTMFDMSSESEWVPELTLELRSDLGTLGLGILVFPLIDSLAICSVTWHVLSWSLHSLSSSDSTLSRVLLLKALRIKALASTGVILYLSSVSCYPNSVR